MFRLWRSGNHLLMAADICFITLALEYKMYKRSSLDMVFACNSSVKQLLWYL